ncbi:hypothetical protein [Arthrobacter sp. NPDC090010]|uniref:hypothetical protein n=1 Tax=Arthrobacter sp. NPDC090010 TaxID=3363942 RepID=UPI00382A9B96
MEPHRAPIVVRDPREADWPGLRRLLGNDASGWLAGLGDAHCLGAAIPRRVRGLPAFRRAIGHPQGWREIPSAVVEKTTTILVAVDAEGVLLGAALVRPDVPFVQRIAHGYASRREEIFVSGLADVPRLMDLRVVPEARRRGIAKALLSAAVWHYELAGAALLYGSVPREPGPAAFGLLRAARMHLAAPGAVLDLSPVYGVPVVLPPQPGQRFFFRDLRMPGQAHWELNDDGGAKNTPFGGVAGAGRQRKMQGST